MKRIFDFFVSSKATVIFLIIIAIAMGAATFIEDKYDTVTARVLVYNTLWFELLFILLTINLIGHIKAYHLFSLKKLGGLLFHLSFVIMILGAGITRYFGSEGSMHIRKGQASNTIFSDESALMISYSENNNSYSYSHPVSIGFVNKNAFDVSIPAGNKGNIDVKYKEIINNAVEKVEENVSGGKDMIEISMPSAMGMESIILENGSIKNLNNILLAYNNNTNKQAVNIVEKNGGLTIVSPYDMICSTMTTNEADTIKPDTLTQFKENYVYRTSQLAFLFTKHYKNAKKVLVSAPGGNGTDAVVLDVTINGKTYTANVMNNSSTNSEYTDYDFDGTHIKFGYGNKAIQLPFSLYLKDFILERYPGSESPSSYKSEVTLIDSRDNLREDHSIFMNNVLDYDHYRFFQSSYDNDGQGTVLSVNHDFWGTLVTYIGYSLLVLGFLITLFSKNSRFMALRKLFANEIKNRKNTAALTILFLLGFTGLANAQNANFKVIDKDHAAKFGSLLVQTFDGRFAPVNTLAIDCMHKIAKQENFDFQGKGKMNVMQAFIDMMAEPEFWQKQKIIYIPRQDIRNQLNIQTEYASFEDFFDAQGQYKLEKTINESFRKKQSEKTKLEKELLKVDERLNIFHMVMNGSILKIFPEQNSENHKWIGWDDKASNIPLTGAMSIINDDLQLKQLTYANIMQSYVFELQKGMLSGDYSRPNKILDYIVQIQRQYSDPSILPSDAKIKAEIFYNQANIFVFLKHVYSALSILLLVLALIDVVKSKKSKFITYSLNILTGILAIAFVYHTIGMALRWYITGHAPWSNGYEALILVAWGSLIAGFSFAKHSKITLAATTLMAFLVLLTAGLSSYDPQLTNLQPVLKSYWLIIHVATLTISYSFLGLGFILGMINLFFYLFKTKVSAERIDKLIAEFSYIIEMNLIIGLMLATIGTFLGAVWANESWGTYWAWDAKETWALIIVVTYSVIIHMRFIPGLNKKYAFNVASVLGFSSVLMTFIGVNYYLSKGMHSYGAGDTPIFPLWAWGTIFAIIALIISAGIKEKNIKEKLL